jgi:hypothetical protein
MKILLTFVVLLLMIGNTISSSIVMFGVETQMCAETDQKKSKEDSKESPEFVSGHSTSSNNHVTLISHTGSMRPVFYPTRPKANTTPPPDVVVEH